MPAPLFKAFRGLRPQDHATAQRLVAPPYDVVSRRQADHLAADNPLSFLHISRAEIDLPEHDSDDPKVYQQAAQNLQQFMTDKALQTEEKEAYYIYAITHWGRQQLGLVVAANSKALQQGGIRRHELTRPDKEADRIQHIRATACHISPVMLLHRPIPHAESLLKELSSRQAPTIRVEYEGIEHALWVIDESPDIAHIDALSKDLQTFYIADGHHRSAAAYAISEESSSPSAKDYFLGISFPSNRVLILPYNRVLKDYKGMDFLLLQEKIAPYFELYPAANKDKNLEHPWEFLLYSEQGWHKLVLRPSHRPAPGDLLGLLPVNILERYVLKTAFDITDSRRDPRLDFVGGDGGLEELEQLVDSQQQQFALALFPTTADQLLAVADADAIMPPKSTWFTPKLLDGLVSYRFSDQEK